MIGGEFSNSVSHRTLQVVGLEREIDDAVYDVFDLTEAERKVVCDAE